MRVMRLSVWGLNLPQSLKKKVKTTLNVDGPDYLLKKNAINHVFFSAMRYLDDYPSSKPVGIFFE